MEFCLMDSVIPSAPGYQWEQVHAVLRLQDVVFAYYHSSVHGNDHFWAILGDTQELVYQFCYGFVLLHREFKASAWLESPWWIVQPVIGTDRDGYHGD